MKSFVALCLLSFVALVCSQNFAQIGTFEGTYDDIYGGELYLCQNGDTLQGQYSEIGLINGVVTNNTVTGKFFQAGFNQCNIGTFEWTLTDEGFEGTYTCNGVPDTQFDWVAKKYDVFRPSDDECGLLYDGDGSTQGHWTIKNGDYTLDSCFTDATVEDQYTVHVSYQTENDGENHPNVGSIHGFSVFNGKIFVGTWYEDLVGGAVLGYLNSNRELVLSFWTGLAGRQGGSIVDNTELNVPDYHWISVYQNSKKTTIAQCTRFEYLANYVNDALYYYEGEIPYVYFVYNEDFELNLDAGFDPIDYQGTNYYLLITANSSNYLTLSVFAVVVALFFF